MMGATGFDGFRPFLLAFLPFAATTVCEPRREVTGEVAAMLNIAQRAWFLMMFLRVRVLMDISDKINLQQTISYK